MSLDLWGYGVPGPGERTAIMANCSDDEYMTGQCAAWAISHQREHPHLRLGIDWQRLTPDHPDWDEEDDGDEAWQPQHIFTHDDHYAYDVRGAHPLSEIRQWDDVTLNHSPEDVMATGMYEGGYEPEPEMVRRVPPHTAHRTARRIEGMPQMYRGLGLRKNDLPLDLSERIEDYLDGNPDDDLHRDLLNHLDREGEGLGTWWSRDSDVASEYVRNGFGPPNYEYEVILGADWDGRGGYSPLTNEDRDFEEDHVNAAIRRNHEMQVGDIRIRRRDGDWSTVPGNSGRWASLCHTAARGEDRPAHSREWREIPGVRDRKITAHRTAMPAIDAYDDGYLDDNDPDSGPMWPMEERYTHQDIQPGPYYHVSPQHFEPGHILVPQNHLDKSQQGALPNHNNWVWMTRHLDGSWPWINPDSNFYEIEPLDEGPWEWDKSDDYPDKDGPRYVSPRARVIRKISPKLCGTCGLQDPEHQPWCSAPSASHTAAHRTAMPWYHNTDAELNPGDELLPATELGFDVHAEHGWNPWSSYDPDRVYFTQHPADPEPHSGQSFGKYTYEVEPIGEVERDPEWEASMEGQPDDYEWDTHDAGYYDYTAPRARVIRKIKPKEARTMTAAVTVYTKPACPQCQMTHKLLDQLGVEHTTVDVTADPEAHAYVTGLGYSSAPVVVVGDGEAHWSGFKPDHLKGLAT